MVGVLFVFVIMIAYFAYKINEDAKLNSLEIYLNKGAEAQEKIVQDVITDLRKLDIDAKSVQSGIVTISGKDMFAPGSSDLESVDGALGRVAKIAETIIANSSCFSSRRRVDDQPACNSERIFIDTIFIEGHTDNMAVKGWLPDGSTTNLELSARRATNTYEQMTISSPELLEFVSPNNHQSLSVAAYGEQRPIADNNLPGGRSENRRIDIRFVMYVPPSNEALKELRARYRGVNETP